MLQQPSSGHGRAALLPLTHPGLPPPHFVPLLFQGIFTAQAALVHLLF